MQTDEAPAAQLDEVKDEARQTPPNPDGTADNLDAVIPPHSPLALPVVGLGGSAGAIAALRDFFSLMPPDSGLAFVVVLHLSPHHESALAEILAASTRMKVMQVSGTTRVEANCVYVIPPDAHLSMDDGDIHLVPVQQERGRRVAVDLFFRALADARGTSAIGVVLSGADSDGTIGLKRIKERGGLTIAQDPEEAQYDSMPRSAIATGMVDWILPITQMPDKLLAHRHNERRIRLPAEAVELLDEVPQESDEETLAHQDESALREILALLRAHTGHDFSSYKRATVLRRIGRRLQVNALENIPAYLAFMRTNPGEAGALFHDLLISVTNFFRDPEAFEALEAAIPQLFRDKQSGEQVRVWVAGCATGEEAYSVAMLLCEYSLQIEAPPSFLIFATDLSGEAIQSAREGIYPESIAADVSPERLRRFFTLNNGSYHVRKELRERILFAPHNLLKDAPFSRLDLITCRNLLIYFNREAQRRAFETFHFALRGGGMLFLGPSESADDADNLFQAADKKHRLYSRNALAHPVVPPLPEASPNAPIFARLPKEEWALSLPSAATLPSSLQSARRRDASTRGASFGDLHLQLLERYAPPSILLDDDYSILHLSQNAGKYLRFAGGEATSNLLQLVLPSLRLELSAALFAASQRGHDVRVAGVEAQRENDGETGFVDLTVRPVRDESGAGRGLLLVLLEESGAASTRKIAAPDAEPLARQLDQEMQQLKGDLRAIVEQYETSVEELKASNEELQAMNEETRSTSEELETSTEELQSLNEELITVNGELKNKVEELARSNSDLQNLMTSTEIGTVFLDRELRIKRFTRRAAPLFNLLPTDLGRPLSNLTHRLEYPALEGDAARVLAQLTPIETEVRADQDRWFLARVLPYRTADDHIDGVVLTFIDISSRKQAETSLRQSEERFRALVDKGADMMTITDATGNVIYASPSTERVSGYSAAEFMSRNSLETIHPDDLVHCLEALQQLASTRGLSLDLTHRFRHKDGSWHWAEGVFTSLFHDPAIGGIVANVRDVTQRKTAECATRESEERFRLLVEGTRDYAMFLMDNERRIIHWNSGAERIFGHSRDEAIGRLGDMIFTPEDLENGAPQKEVEIATRDGSAADLRWHLRKSGERFWVDGVMTALRDENGELRGFAKIARDATPERLAEETLQRAHDDLEKRVLDRTQELANANEKLRRESIERQQLEKARESLLQRVVGAQEEERRRISRELHDQLGQQLTALLLGLKSLPHIEDNGMRPPSVNARIEALETLADELMQHTHRLAWELRPASLDTFGLEPALRQYVEEWCRQSGIEADLLNRDAAGAPRLPLDVEIALYRVAQEALTNVQRHAQASQVSVVLERCDGHVTLIIEDDGHGFQIEQDENGLPLASSQRLGLLGMQERMELARGTLAVESSPRGTTIYARVLAEETGE